MHPILSEPKGVIFESKAKASIQMILNLNSFEQVGTECLVTFFCLFMYPWANVILCYCILHGCVKVTLSHWYSFKDMLILSTARCYWWKFVFGMGIIIKIGLQWHQALFESKKRNTWICYHFYLLDHFSCFHESSCQFLILFMAGAMQYCSSNDWNATSLTLSVQFRSKRNWVSGPSEWVSLFHR